MRDLFHALHALLGDAAEPPVECGLEPARCHRRLSARKPIHPPPTGAADAPRPRGKRGGANAAARRAPPPALSRRASLLGGLLSLDLVEAWDDPHEQLAARARRALELNATDGRPRALVVTNAGLMHFIGTYMRPDAWARARLEPLARALGEAARARDIKVWYGPTAVTALRKARYSRGRALALDAAARAVLLEGEHRAEWSAQDNDAITAARADATSDGLHYPDVSALQAAVLLSHVCSARGARQ